MKLRPRLLAMALAVSLPCAVLLYFVQDWLRSRDERAFLDRFVVSQLTDDTRERCESNPNWFLAGPRPDRPTPQQLAAPDADVYAPRPQIQSLPFDYFAYDDRFEPLSTAGPRFPTDFRQALRSGAKKVSGPFSDVGGTGQQEAVLTGWTGSQCLALLFRMRALPGQRAQAATIFISLVVLLFGIAVAAGWPIVERSRKLGIEARNSAADEYRPPVTVSGRDEMSALAFAFNEAAAAIRQRDTDIKDREDSLRRYLASTAEHVSGPLLALESTLGRISAPSGGASQADVDGLLADVHTLAMRVQNLSAAATLRMSLKSAARDRVDLSGVIQRVIARQSPFAAANGVTVVSAPAVDSIAIAADQQLVEQAVNNLVDNAIRYNRAGGQVTVSLDRTRDGRFSLRVADDGPGAPDEVIAKLNANRRFRGDEGRDKRTGELGLGLAIVREVGDRFGVQWAFRKNSRGWFEAELTGPIS
jgi:signal transduction histidine kinase